MMFIINKSSGNSFSKRSGDYNKIHINENYGYNSIYGKIICHGCNVFKKAIKNIDKKNLFNNEKNQINIFFNEYFSYNQKIFLEKKKKYYYLKQDNKIKSKINYFFNKKFQLNEIVNSIKYLRPKLKINIKYTKNKLNNLNNILNLLSKYVGMIYPGKNSIIENIRVHFSKDEVKIKNGVYSKRLNKKFPFIKNYIIFKNFIIEFDTLIRPFLIKKKIKPSKTLTQKILSDDDCTLVIGASSGLGYEILNLFLMNKKKKIYATYFKNLIKEKSKNLNIINLNIYNDITDIISLIIKNKIKKIYYFPSEKISMKPSDEQIKNYKKIYLDIPLKILKKLSNHNIKFFYPSTTFISDYNKHSRYSKFKYKAEIELNKLMKEYENLKISIIRFPQLNTKQNLNLLNVKYPNFIKYLNLNTKIQKKIFFQNDHSSK